MANTLTGLTLVKRFTYRGNPDEEFSNTYWWIGAPWATAAEWNTFALNTVIAIEQQIEPTDVSYVRYYGYAQDGGAHHVATFEWAQDGTQPKGVFVPGGGLRGAGDQAGCVEWLCDSLSRKGKPVYLRKYLHPAFISASDHDSLDAAWVTALNTYAAAIRNAHSGMVAPDTLRPLSTAAARVIPFVTTRTLKRRGKRPIPPA